MKKKILSCLIAGSVLFGGCFPVAALADSGESVDTVIQADAGIMIGEKDGRYGLYTYDGRIWLPPIYQNISSSQANVYVVQDTNGKYGLWHMELGWLLPCDYDAIGEYFEAIPSFDALTESPGCVIIQKGVYPAYATSASRST